MDWLFRSGGSTGPCSARSLVGAHLESHARAGADLDGALDEVDEMAATVAGDADRLLWGHLEWTSLRPSLAVHRLVDDAAAALSEAGVHAEGAVHPTHRALLCSLTDSRGPRVSLPVERDSLQEKAFDPALMAAVDVDPVRDGMAGVPATLLAAAEAYPTASAAQLASATGARLADVVAGGHRVGTAQDVANLFVEAHRAMGGGPEVLLAGDDRIEMAVDGCPFAEESSGPRSLCRVCVAMLGRLAARVNGGATVVPEESTGLGDALCHLHVFMDKEPAGVDGQVFLWPGGQPHDTEEAPRMELSVTLPRETSSVPVVRRLAAQTLRAFGVTDEHIDDVQLAITEACANVVDHAVDTDTYEVRIELAADRCAITVVDQGTGFDPARVPDDVPDEGEAGRGIRLMRALVDTMAFEDQPRSGAVVHLVKELEYDRDHPLHVDRG